VVSYHNLAEQDTLLRQQVLNYAQQGEYSEAIAILSRIITRNPNNASDYNNRGLLHFQNGCSQKALADYNKALQLNPRLAKIYNNRANCYVALGRLTEAIADYETAIDLNPANIHARLNQGITFRDMGLHDLAVETFDLALQLVQFLHSADAVESSPSLEGHLYAERGRAHHLAGDWNYAVADYQRALTQLLASSQALTSYRLSLQVENWLNDLLDPIGHHQD
jgi:tetratricopeptide (TPR) repeat protein